MLRPSRLGLGVSLVLLTMTPTSGVWGDSGDTSYWLDWLDDDAWEQAGLHKLSEEELEYLSGLMVRDGGPSYLAEEAMSHLERAGWCPVEVVGAFEAKHKRWVALLGPEGPALVEAWSIIDPLPTPGVHWGKEIVGSWDIFGIDGVSRHYTEP